MDYHKPPNIEWSPDELAKQLRDLGVNARNESDRVVIDIELPENDSQRSQASSPSEAEARDLVGGALDESLHIDIAYFTEPFIRNIRIKRDRTIGKYFNLFNKEINQVLTRQGFLAVTHEVQGSIARQYCSDVRTIEAIEAEIENHRRAKEKFVEIQKFEEAARALHHEKNACNRLDALVRDHVIDSLNS